MNITPVILCGGSGTRLWPLSRAGFPKQFLVLFGTNSLFQQAVERINNIAADDITVGETLIVTNEEHRFLALDQLREMKSVSATLLLEPIGRNTAPALTLAALQASANGDDPILVVTPADAVLVADRSQSQHVKKLVTALQQQHREEHSLHRKVHRPWGWYDSIDEEDRFKVKRIQVKPKASLSL
jgi:mannose-1-phosphate guanylyltransferase/mannose-6-phosphate isomerase